MKKRNPIFDSLGYVPPVVLSEKQLKIKRIEAQKELEAEKIKRRQLHDTDIEAWKKYKEETREKISKLHSIVTRNV